MLAKNFLENAGETEARLLVKPTTPLLAELVDKTKVKKLFLSRKIHALMPKGTPEAMEKVGVEIVTEERKKGRPFTRDSEVVEHVKKLGHEGNSAKQISEKLFLPLRTVYYYLRGK